MSAKADGALTSLIKLIKRNRAVSGVLAVALIVLVSVTAAFVTRLKDERDVAQAAVAQRLAEELANSADMAAQVVRAADSGFLREAGIRAAAISAPASPWGPYARGYLAWKKGEADTALAEFATALERDPTHIESTNAMAAVKAAQGEVSEASALVANLDAVTRWRSALDAGDTLYAARDYANALTAYRKTTELIAKAPGVSDEARKRVDAKLGDAKAWIACADFARAIAKLPVRQREAQINSKLKEVGGGIFEADIENGAIIGGRIRNARRLQPFHGQSLRQLRFYGGSLRDLDPLRGIALRNLHLLGLPVADLGPLRGMPLVSLNIAQTRVTNLEPLSGMPLEHLDAADGGIRDLSPLASCPLRKLVLHHQSQVKDLTPLSGLPLEYLDLNLSGVTDLEPLRGLPLTYLNASYNKIHGISALAGMPLETLNINETEVRDLGPLRGASIKSLRLTSTRVSDLSPLAGMPLRSIQISYSPVSDISPLADAPLTWIDLSHSNVADLSPLKGAPLGGLSMRHTPVTDLAPLRGMSLTSIDANASRISDLSPLANMPLTVIAFAATRVRDFGPLATLKNIDVGKCPWVPYLLDKMPREEFLKRCKLEVRHLYDGMKLEADGKLEHAAVAWQAHLDSRYDLGEHYARGRLQALKK